MSKGTCWECEAEGVHIHNHHVVPRSRGGTKTVPLCEACHAHAHHRGKAMATSKLTLDAMAAKQARGECVGTAPVGYRLAADGRTLETNPAEAKVVATIHELRAAGMSMRAIGAELARLGITTRKGGPIQTTQIARIITRGVTP